MTLTHLHAGPRWLLLLALIACASHSQAAEKIKPIALSPAQLQVLEGEYASAAEPDTPLEIHALGSALWLESERRVPVELVALTPLEFAPKGEKSTLKFALDSAGHAASLLWTAESDAPFKRAGDPVHHLFHDYQRTEVMIPMRDGVKLHTVILKPADIAKPLPFLIQRTPYGADGLSRASFHASRPELARAGYIFVAQDIRGRFKSEGEFVMSRPLADHKDPKAVDESTDAWDTVDWLVKNIANNNGRAGFVGTSYPGFLAMMAGIDPHPAVKAVSPQAPMIDVWMGDDFFHNGAFRMSYGYDYVYGMENSRGETEVSYGKDAQGMPRDGYDFFLEQGSFERAVRQAKTKKPLPTWQLFLEHPGYDATWRSRGVQWSLNKVAVPTLTVGGYYDQEDMFGPEEEYARLEPADDQRQNFLVLGPWRHGSWGATARHLGALDYGRPIGRDFRADLEAKFFAKFLKDEPGFDLEDTASFESGTNTWKRYSHFPPFEAQSTALHLMGEGQLGWGAAKTAAATTYTSDPANPVPYRHRPIQVTYSPGSRWSTWLVEDQRFVADRKDVALWRLPALKKDLILTGEVTADLFLSTTGSDTDLVVKLIDEYPADDPDPKMRGYQLMTNAEIFRGRYLESFETPRPIRPGAVKEFRYSLHDVDHVFKAGHTVLVEVQSSWFPLYDRNPQTFVPNIMTAKPEDYKPAAVTVYSGQGRDSRLLLPVMNPCDQIACF